MTPFLIDVVWALSFGAVAFSTVILACVAVTAAGMKAHELYTRHVR